MIDYKIILGDTHIPWEDKELLKSVSDVYKFYSRKKDHKVTVIQMGDSTDQKAWSRFSKDVDDYSPTEEWEKTVEGMLQLSKMFPEMHILTGNHCRRVMQKAFEASLPKQLIKGLEQVFDYPGWKWHLDNKPLVLDKVAFLHGDETGGSAVAKAKRMGMSVVQGHDHQGYVEFINTFDHKIFGMGVGCMIDPAGSAFRYSAKNPMTCFIGYGEIIDGRPNLIQWS